MMDRTFLNLNFQVLATKAEIFIVMELVEGGDLLDLIEREEHLEEGDAMKYFASIVDAVKVCVMCV